MIDAIEELHSIDYIHQDIKPENFMISKKDGRVHLIDFGLSKR